jgi:hypothetical protein
MTDEHPISQTAPLYPDPFDFGLIDFDAPCKLTKIFDGCKESLTGWTCRVLFNAITYTMFLNHKSENHRYLHQELDKLMDGQEFYFTKIETDKGIKYFITLEEPIVEKLHKSVTGDRSMSATDRVYLSSASLMCFGTKDRDLFLRTYREIHNSFPKNQNLTADQRNILFCVACVMQGSSVTDMIAIYKSLINMFDI